MALAAAGMNDVFKSQGYIQAEWSNRIPIAAWSLILTIALLCNVLVGYGAHSDVHKSPLLVVLPLVVSLTVALVADIDSPRGGVIRSPLKICSSWLDRNWDRESELRSAAHCAICSRRGV
jgi:hypothetical protein